jgi:hypothetical protein
MKPVYETGLNRLTVINYYNKHHTLIVIYMNYINKLTKLICGILRKTSASILIIDRLFSFWSVMVDLSTFLVRFNAENDRSPEQLLTINVK